MPCRVWELTPSQTEQAKYLRSMGRFGRMDPRTIAKRMNVSEEALRRALNLNPKKKLYDDATKAARKFEYFKPSQATLAALEERDRAYLCDDTIGVVLLGEPRPGRSALDKRNACTNSA